MRISRRWWFLAVPVGHGFIFVIYWLLSGEPAGAVMSILFATAIGVMGFSLLPTLNDTGPTAPVDEDWSDGH